MNIVEMLMDEKNSAAIGQIARQFNLDQGQTQDIIGQLGPALAKGMQSRMADGGLDDLVGSLKSGGHQQYLENPETLATEGVSAGNSILGQILGSKQASREVASQAASQTGVDSGILKQMLPMIASVAMGAMSQKAGGAGAASTEGVTGMLAGLIDADNDGSVVDDLAGMASKFFR